MDQHDLTATQFGSTARKYLTSSVHASGADLVRLTELADKLRVTNVLDLGCGAGHASFALAQAGAHQVVAYDIAAPMLEVVSTEAAVRGHVQIKPRKGAAERLAFMDASFDMVVTRYSAHHWLNVRMALGEASRVLRPGGILVVIDVLAPENPLLDTVLQTIEILRDVSHVRNYRESEWRAMLDAVNFSEFEVDRWKLPMDFQSWVARIGTSAPRIAALHAVFDDLAVEAREYFALSQDHSFAMDAGWFQATKR